METYQILRSWEIYPKRLIETKTLKTKFPEDHAKQH